MSQKQSWNAPISGKFCINFDTKFRTVLKHLWTSFIDYCTTLRVVELELLSSPGWSITPSLLSLITQGENVEKEILEMVKKIKICI